MTCRCSVNESVIPCNQSDSFPAALCVHSSDDYYEYGHSGESYDSYGEFLLLSEYLFFTSCACYSCNTNTILVPKKLCTKVHDLCVYGCVCKILSAGCCELVCQNKQVQAHCSSWSAEHIQTQTLFPHFLTTVVLYLKISFSKSPQNIFNIVISPENKNSKCNI